MRKTVFVPFTFVITSQLRCFRIALAKRCVPLVAVILQLHTRKNERLTLGTTRVTKDRNNGDAANALGNYVVPRESRLVRICSERLFVESSSCHRLQSLSPGRERPSQNPNKAN